VKTLLRRLVLLAAALAAPVAALGDAQLSLPGLDGANHTLADWRGRTVLLDFWAAWCDPCITGIPHLLALEQRYRQRGLSIVSVGIDEPDKLRNVVRTLAIDYPVLLLDPGRAQALLEAWGDKRGVIPYLVLIDRQGRIAATHRGPIEPDELEQMVKPLLAPEAGASARASLR
jgi:thiol-disulfide isomerase/thioredoxin